MNYFYQRKAFIATMHGKEQIIAPMLKSAFEMEVELAPKINTDCLGTFTGEVERPGSPLETLRKKCELAFEIESADLAVASEGSFGPHPAAFFVPANEEFVMLREKSTGLEIVGKALSTETNFAAKELQNERELLTFCEAVGFPEHGIILRPSKEDFTGIFKGLRNRDDLLRSFCELKERFGRVYAETDMRAMHNPTRMKVIAQATQSLIDKMNSYCPACRMPGFDILKSYSGLPCSLCGMPTKGILSTLYQCKFCGFEEVRERNDGKKEEDPMYCDFCNP